MELAHSRRTETKGRRADAPSTTAKETDHDRCPAAVCELASRAALAADRVRLAAERAESWAAAEVNYQGWALEVERLGRLKALFPGHRIERVLSPSRAWQFTAVSPDGGVKVSALTVASLERKLQRQNHLDLTRIS